MKRFRELLSRITGKGNDPASFTEFIYVMIPASIGPLDRGAQFGEPVDVELRLAGIGEVSGGGSLLGEADADGHRPIEFCGIDVDTRDTAAARELLRHHLPGLGCPPGTELHYSEGDVKLLDRFDGHGWLLGQPRDFLHPGFGC